MAITQGDDTGAFGNTWLNIELSEIPEGYSVKKLKLIFGAVDKDYNNPEFPLAVNLTAAETKILRCGVNTGYVICYDQNNNPQTCEGSFTDTVLPRKG